MARAHERFVGEADDRPGVRAIVADSWLRSAAAGVDAEAALPPVALVDGDLTDYREQHPLAAVVPVLTEVLGPAASDIDAVMAIGDAAGRLLWITGSAPQLRRAERINFVEGSVWDEAHAGTNAPGTAVRLDAAVTIHAAEHYNRQVHAWSCAAAPIHDPSTAQLIGVVDLTGGTEVAAPQSIALVRTAARLAEAELAWQRAESGRLWRPTAVTPGRVLHLSGLGRPDLRLTINGHTQRLSLRHSEFMVALALAPEGLSGEQLQERVYPSGAGASTVRAELNRLRALLGEAALQSRPYRLAAQVSSDWAAVTADLAAGRLAEAMRSYTGPLLPASEAPVVAELRDRIALDLRAALLTSGAPDLLLAWTHSDWGADDLAVWRRQAELLPAGSPLRGPAIGAVRRLDAELGSAALLRPPGRR